MNKRTQKTTAKGIFYKKGRILFLKDKKNNWELPGGRIKFGESPEKALKRECKEELGFKNVSVLGIVDSWCFLSKVNKTNYHFILLIYECKTNQEEIKKSSEHTEHKWILPKEIKKLKTREGYRKTIQNYLKLK